MNPLALWAVLLAAGASAASAAPKMPTGAEGPPAKILDTVVSADFLAKTPAPPSPTDAAASAAQAEINSSLLNLNEMSRRAEPKDREALIRSQMAGINDSARGAPSLNPKTNNGLAAINNSLGNWDLARSFAQDVLRGDPKNVQAKLNLATADLGLRRPKDAAQLADEILAADPNNSQALRTRAMASYLQGLYGPALEDARKSSALDPEDPLTKTLIKLAKSRVAFPSRLPISGQMTRAVEEEYQGMISEISEASTVKPSAVAAMPSVRRLLGEAGRSIELKDYARAVSAAQKASAEDPRNSLSYYYVAVAANLMGDYKRAIDAATRALVLDPSNIPARDARAWAYNRLGNVKDSLADARHALRLNPRDSYALAQMGYAHERMGDISSMLHDLKLAAEFSPRFAASYTKAALRYGLKPDLPAQTSGMDLSAAQDETPEGGPEKGRRNNSFAVVLLSSLVGGGLIAAGIISLLLPPKPPKTLKAQHGLDKRAAGADGPPVLKNKKGKTPQFSRAIDASYSIGRMIGAGGMGVVYEGFDKALERRVAVKMMREELSLDPKAKERFLAEARTVAALHHHGIVDIHAILEDESGLYLVFEYIEGRTVENILAEKKRLSPAETKAIFKPVCQALDYAHRRGVIHRDLKPSNIMVTDQGVKLMDFGISRHAEEALRSTSSLAAGLGGLGTPYYMAPEQEYGVVRPEADVFSMGACLYEMATGRRPFPDPADAHVKFEADYPKPSRAAGSPWGADFDAFIDKALAPDPDKRIRSAREFWAGLEPIKAADKDAAPAS